jgi:hypothetical protein
MMMIPISCLGCLEELWIDIYDDSWLVGLLSVT